MTEENTHPTTCNHSYEKTEVGAEFHMSPHAHTEYTYSMKCSKCGDTSGEEWTESSM